MIALVPGMRFGPTGAPDGLRTRSDEDKAVVYLYEKWPPGSGEAPGGFPIFFHDVSIGPGVREEKMVTDVYLPLE